MRKAIFLGFSFSFVITQCVSGFVIEETISETTSYTKKNEKHLRNMLYNSYMYDDIFYKKKCSTLSHSFREKKNFVCSYELFSNIDFFITILEDHIEKLEKKLSRPKRFFQYSSFYKGLAFLSLGAASIYSTYLFFNHPSWPKKEDYMEKITDLQEALKMAKETQDRNPFCRVSNDFLHEYSKSKFKESFACRHYFNDFERAQCLKNFKNFEQRFQYLEVYHINKHIDHEKPYVCRTVGLLGASALCFVGAYMAFSKFCASTRRYKEYLKRDKNLLAILKAEKCSPEDRSKWCHI